MAKRKSKKKQPEPVKQEFNEDFIWEWTSKEEPEIILYMQRLANHMVSTGLEMGLKRTPEEEEARLDHVEKIMETGEYEMSQEEMEYYLPTSLVKEKLYEYSKPAPFSDDSTMRFMTDESNFNLCNKLAELCVYAVMRELEKQGYLKLSWDPDKNDFVYVPVKDDGED
jgi:hypothetical protein